MTPGAVRVRYDEPSPRRPAGPIPLVLLALALALASAPAHAQRVTASIQGNVARGDAPEPDATVVATNLANGAVVTVTSDGKGFYVLAGLAPGQYLITVTPSGGGEGVFNSAEIGIGQSVELNINLDTAPKVPGAEVITVQETTPMFETKTSEVATNVSQRQIKNLPQNDRNFLNFAVLAPGVRLNTDELAKNVNSGGLEARQTNVFIDGLSFKNNIIEGGVVGQDASRGNPFPQLAVSGFRILTQNYKAEYEQAGTAIISTLTRSGGNDFHGEAFAAFQNKALVKKDPFVEERGEDEPSYTRYQVGALGSGPIIKDKLFALLSYEGNYQNRAANVTISMRTPENLARFGQYEGTFTSPFREHLVFGKISFLPESAQTLDLSVFVRARDRRPQLRTGGHPDRLRRRGERSQQRRHRFAAPPVAKPGRARQ